MLSRCKWAPAAVSVVALSLSACAAWRGGELPPVTGWPPSTSVGKKSVSLVVTGRITFNDDEKDMVPAVIKLWSDRAQKQYQQSNLFSSVTAGLSQTDLRADVAVTDNGEGSMGLAFLTGLTLYVLPSTASDHLTIKTTFRDDQGDVLGEITKKETVTLWQQLFLVFLMPFKFPPSVTFETIDDLFRASLVEAASKGYLR